MEKLFGPYPELRVNAQTSIGVVLSISHLVELVSRALRPIMQDTANLPAAEISLSLDPRVIRLFVYLEVSEVKSNLLPM